MLLIIPRLFSWGHGYNPLAKSVNQWPVLIFRLPAPLAFDTLEPSPLAHYTKLPNSTQELWFPPDAQAALRSFWNYKLVLIGLLTIST